MLRGWYKAITLAVYGVLTKNVQEQVAPPSAPGAAHTHPHAVPGLSHSHSASESRPPTDSVPASAATQEWVQQHTQVSFLPAFHLKIISLHEEEIFWLILGRRGRESLHGGHSSAAPGSVLKCLPG